MGALLESGLVGNIGLKHLKVIKEDTINKWDKLGFLEGLKGHMRENVAQLYENQASYLINEASSTSDTGSFETVVFPIVRRVFSKLLANDIVSVQAMNLPIGKLFYFVPKIQQYVGGANGTQHYAPIGSPEAVDSGQNNPNQGYGADNGKDLYDRFYEGNEPALDPPGLFDYSKGQFSSVTAPNVTVVWVGDSLVASGYTAGEYRKVLLVMSGFSNAGSYGKLMGPDGNTVDTETFLSDLTITSTPGTSPWSAVTGNLLFRVVTQKYGKGIVEYGGTSSPAFGSSNTANGGSYDNICDADGKIYLEADFQVPCSIGAVTERKLRAQWSPEMAQDVSAFHNIDAEAELTALLSEQVAAEIDREILRDLRKGAAWTLRWDYNGWKRGTTATPLTQYTQKDWNQTLITAINQISAQIHKSTLRGGANWIVVSSEISAIFDDLEYFHVSNAAPEQDQYNMGIERIGTLAGRYQVYRDPYFPPNTVLLGHKGNSLLDTGYVYAPYVPLQLTPTMYNPFNFTPIKGIMTRYAKKMVNNRFYGKVTVDGVRTFDLRELR